MVCAVVTLLEAEGVSQNEIHHRLVSVYSQKVFSQKEVWCNKFKDGQTALNDDAQKHRVTPRTSHREENCVIKGLVRVDRRVKSS
jgi:hypothetical protein